MKRRTFLSFLMGVLILSISFGASTYIQSNVMPLSEQSENVNMVGRFETGGLRSGSDPIIVTKSFKTLYITFQKDLDIINISIQGPQGIVYESSIDTSSSYNLIIPMDNLPSGNNTISFFNQYGSMQGDFSL